MIVGIPCGIDPGERRVALVAESVERLPRKGLDVRIQSGAGAAPVFANETYRPAGGEIIDSREAPLGEVDPAIKSQPPTIPEDAERLKAKFITTEKIWVVTKLRSLCQPSH